MKNTLLLLSLLLIPTMTWAGGMNDDPVLTMLSVGQLEIRDDNGDSLLAWEADAWLGKDLHKLWLKTEGEYNHGRIEEMEVQALYSRGITPFWDLQMGWRRDIRPTPERDWLAIGLQGLAPYYLEIDTALFIGDSGRTSLRLQIEYEIMLSQQLILSPELEINFYGKDDPATGIGSGLADIEAGLRLRYEIRREFAPYVGLNWNRLYGQTADFARDEGEDIDHVQLVIGIRAWF